MWHNRAGPTIDTPSWLNNNKNVFYLKMQTASLKMLKENIFLETQLLSN